MTTSELISLLQTMPPDAVVIRRQFSDYVEIEADDVALWKDGKLTPDNGSFLVEHQGRIMFVRPHWIPPGEAPKPLTAVYIG